MITATDKMISILLFTKVQRGGAVITNVMVCNIHCIQVICVVDVPGTLIVNDEPAYTGLAPGQFVGLDLVENMYLGGVPNFQTIPRAAGFNQGFVGMSEVISRNLFSQDLCVCQNLFDRICFQRIFM